MKLIILLFTCLLLQACDTNQESNTKLYQLKKAAEDCRNSVEASCQKTLERYGAVEQLAIFLESSPQAFGMNVIAIESKLASIQSEIAKIEQGGGDREKVSQLKELHTRLRKQLDEHMAVLRWFEAPSS